MALFKNLKGKAEQEVMVNLLSEIERNPQCTQRGLAQEFGVALGMMNQYLKRCISKGWVRASQVSPRRISYFLTPEGFKEKSLMVKDYLSHSLTLFRDAKAQCEEVFETCQKNGWKKIGLVGEGDLADIARLVARSTDISLQSFDASSEFFDAVLIVDMKSPQQKYESLKSAFSSERILSIDLLHVLRRGG